MPKNLIGIHAGVLVRDWSQDSAEYAVRESVNAGFDLIEIPAGEANEIDVVQTRRLLSDSGMTGVFSLALPAHADINSEDQDTVGRGKVMLEDAVKLAAAAGSTYVGGVLYSKWANTTDHHRRVRVRTPKSPFVQLQPKLRQMASLLGLNS